MRKYFWGLGVCGAVVLCAVVALARHGAQHPDSFIGRCLYGASIFATKVNPITGLGPALANLKKHEAVTCSETDVSDSPTSEEPACHQQDPQVPTVRAAIVIPEDDTVVYCQRLETIEMPMPKHHTQVVYDSTVECPPGSVCTAPARMPYCHEECELLPEPAVEEATPTHCTCGFWIAPLGWVLGKVAHSYAEQAPMPTEVSGEEEAASVPTPATESIPANPPIMQNSECREDPHHHHHYSGCPYTGRCCPQQYTTPTKVEVPSGEEQQSSVQEPSGSKSALKAIKRYKSRMVIDEVYQRYFGVDTMEMRPSDWKLYEFGPGAL